MLTKHLTLFTICIKFILGTKQGPSEKKLKQNPNFAYINLILINDKPIITGAIMKIIFSLSAILFIFFNFIWASEEARLLRFPAIYENQVVFTYAGDLYTVPTKGGIARKLTNSKGFELFARFSPDGKSLAFTAQYDGNTEVYVMPAEGGVPIRLTFTATLNRDDVSDRMGPNNIVMGWTHLKPQIIFRSRRKEWNPFIGQLYTVSLKGELPKQIPLPRGGFCSFSGDDQQLAYNRIFREFRTWKRYRGGMSDDIWIYNFKTKRTRNLTNNPAQDIIPMWKGDRIYFLSDRGKNKRMNLYVYDLSAQKSRRLTDFSDFDIKFPSLGKKAVIFEKGGYLFRFDLQSEKIKRIPVFIDDDRLGGRTEIIKVNKKITNSGISPDGKRALFDARGDIFTVPAQYGPTRNLTQTSGIHERNAQWSPDGKWIAYISDKSGEDEIYLIGQDGQIPARQLTSGATTYKYRIIWSPDSKKLLWSDKKLRLRYINISTRKIKEVAQAQAWEIRSYCWSPDSKWISYARPERKTLQKIYLYSLKSGQTFPVTDGWYASGSPAFSSDGKYLFFVSNRAFNPLYSWVEYDYAFQDMARIYLVTLSQKVKSPFAPKSDEVKTGTKKNARPDKKESKVQPQNPVVVKVDSLGLKERLVSLPIPASAYSHLISVGDKLYYSRNGAKDKKSLLLVYDLKKHKETELGQIDGYAISADHKKMLVLQNKSYAVIDVPKAKIEIKDTLKLDDLQVRLNRRAEWRQIYNECWRQMREFFYSPTMNGVNWPNIRKKYAALLPYVNHRADLTYLIGEMIGEINNSHTYVGGGDYPKAKRIKTGLLGAQLQRDAKSGYYRIKKILAGQNWNTSLRSPLTAIGVQAKAGDYILAVNGEPTNQMSNIYASLVNTVGKQVTLTLNSKPLMAGSHNEIVLPIADEQPLYYFDWVQENIRKVNKATRGKVGYVHIPDMGREGLVEFVKYFYPQLKKKALIIDVRGNGGGSVSPLLIERLRRKVVMMDIARNTVPDTDPRSVLYGPKVCLMDEHSASDGDIFPYRFKQDHLGKLIGKRSWGGVIGIRSSLPLLDGGYLYKPEFAIYAKDGSKWIVEGHGVDPDIVVDNDPAKEFAGIDQQLNKAIEVIMQELKTQEKTIPPPPPYPDRSK